MKRMICHTAAVLFSACLIAFCAGAAYAQPGVSAASAALMETSSRTLLMDVNAHTRMPMASTTKIMTALVALEHCPDLTRAVRISEKAVGVEGSSIYLTAGETLTMEQLLYALLLESANDAAAAIAIEIAGDIPAFADMMNETAARLRLTDTHFTNPHGLDDEEHYTTAYDLALLACSALENPDFARLASTYRTTIPLRDGEGTRVLVNHNRLLKSYDGAIGVKTGYTRRCGRCLVSAAARDGVTMVAVTLAAPDDWQDHTAMLDYGFSQYVCAPLADAGEIRIQLSCLGSDTESVTASNREAVSAVLPAAHGAITVTIEANRYLSAPITAGDVVGEIVFRCDSAEIVRTPLVSETDAACIPAKKSVSDRIQEWLRIT